MKIVRFVGVPTAGGIGYTFAGSLPPCQAFRIVNLANGDLGRVNITPNDFGAYAAAQVLNATWLTITLGSLYPGFSPTRPMAFTAEDNYTPNGLVSGLGRTASLTFACIERPDLLDDLVASHDSYVQPRAWSLLYNGDTSVAGGLTSDWLYLGEPSAGGCIYVRAPASAGRSGTITVNAGVQGFGAVPAGALPIPGLSEAIGAGAYLGVFSVVNCKARYINATYARIAAGAAGELDILGSSAGRRS